MILNEKIDFAAIFTVENANPNGDPLSFGAPRQDYEGYGIISSECIKRKIRDRLLEKGEPILIQAQDRSNDGYTSIKERVLSIPPLKESLKKDAVKSTQIACETWIDVRAFGAVLAFKGQDAVSLGIRGPVSVREAKSIDVVDIVSQQITKSLNLEKRDDRKEGKSRDTIGMRYFVQRGVYVMYGGIFPQLAQRTGFSTEDAEKVQQAIIHLFDNDASAARPAGSMEVAEVYWWVHPNSPNGLYSSARVHNSLKVTLTPSEEYPYFKAELNPLSGLNPQIYQNY